MYKNPYRPNKYKAQKVYWEGEEFDSSKEWKRYLYLQELMQQGQIQNLRRQVKYVLIPSQYEEEIWEDLKGKKVKKKHCIEREVDYYADFVYERDGQTIVEDTKGFKTKDYIIKRKLMLWVHKIQINEI